MNLPHAINPRIIVCGDVMLDHNVYTNVEKLANEAPIPVYNKQCEEYQLGGCGNVAKNLCGLGCEKVYLFSVVGNDPIGLQLSKLLGDSGIENKLVTQSDYSTTTKQRFFCDNRIMFRCDTENDQKAREKLNTVSFTDDIEKILQTEKIDCIILSDYNKGVLHTRQCQDIIRIANKYGVFTCVDPKHDYLKYIGCSLIKPNRKEAYSLFGLDADMPIERLHENIYSKVQCRYSVITLAEKGISLYDGSEFMKEEPIVHKIIDVTGAGDVVCSILGYFMPYSVDIRSTLQLATKIATKSVEFPGTYTTQSIDLIKHARKCISLEVCKGIRRPIVFTNGCFDILHSGHIELFKFCKERGTVVVGLNSDDSIRRLKGHTRPINPLKVRLDILESIQYIDHIVVFDEDTPYKLLEQLRPDYLVKGGDYNVDEIVGNEFAGKTLVCEFVKNNSSTAIIEKIIGSC